MVFNAGNNALNQIYDLEIDRVNKGKPSAAERADDDRAGLGVHRGDLRADAGAGLAGRAGRASRVLLDRPRRDHRDLHLFGAAAADEAALGIWANITIAVPRGVLLKVAGWSAVKTVIGRRAVVHRRHLRPVPARRIDDQGLRRHGRRSARRLPDAADSVRRAARRVDDLAVVRRAVSPHQRRHVRPASSPATPLLLHLLGAVMTVYGLYVLLPDAQAAGRSRRRGEPRLVGAHVPNDVRRADRVRARVLALAEEARRELEDTEKG